MENSLKAVKVDGSLYEGGGQMFRNSLALSTITSQPVKLEKIRANRPNPGLNRQLQTGISIMGHISGSQVEGNELKSQVVTYIPKSIRSGNFKGDCQTAGSIALMIQMTMPSLLFGKKISKVNLKGGTCVAKSPPVRYFDKIFFPLLQKFGINANVKVIEEGFYPLGGGEAELIVEPLKGKPLQAVQICWPGKIKKIYVQVITNQDDKATADSYLAQIKEEVSRVMRTKYTEEEVNAVEITLESIYSEELMKVQLSARPKEIGKSSMDKDQASPTEEDPKRILYGVILFVSGEDIYYDCSCVCNKEVPHDKAYIKNVIKTFDFYFKSGSCVDEHLQDQLLIFMLLAKGKSEIICTKPITDHTISCFYVFKLFFPQFEYKIFDEQDGDLAKIVIEGLGIVA